MTRIERLRQLIEEPLLVTMPVNVFYLTGFRSSNAALLVDDERALLFSDFRYAEAGRRVEEVEFVEVERALVRGVAAYVDGRLAFERSHLTYANWEVLRDAGVELVPGGGQIERLRAVKAEEELELIGARPRSRTRRTRGWRRSASWDARSETSRSPSRGSSTSSADTPRPSRRPSPRAPTAPPRTQGRATG